MQEALLACAMCAVEKGGAQASQALCPNCSEDVPRVQNLHSLLPASAAVPGMHGMHSWLAVRPIVDVPAAHGVHANIDMFLMLPAAQGTHARLVELRTQPGWQMSHFGEPSRAVWPMAQMAQSELPASALKVPAMQGLHASATLLCLKVPGTQATQVYLTLSLPKWFT